MTDELRYSDLALPYYKNTNAAINLRAEVDGKMTTIPLSIVDITYACEVAGLNVLYIAETGRGKTQLVTDIARHHFGGTQTGGNANFFIGRPNLDLDDELVVQNVDLTSGKFNSDTSRQINIEKTRRPLWVIDEANRAPKLVQNQFFDVANGEKNFKGCTESLGLDGYCLFLATANMNRVNGDYQGTSEFDKALLDRAHFTINVDYKPFRPTADDRMDIYDASSNPKIEQAPLRDISKKIITAHKSLVRSMRNEDLQAASYLFGFLIDEGFDYCAKDKLKEKAHGFMRCSECDFEGKDLCSLVKSSSDRSVKAVRALGHALSYIAQLKIGKEISVDPLDAMLQAYRFTSYHRNLNENIEREEYDGRKQLMMDTVVERLGAIVQQTKSHIHDIRQCGTTTLMKIRFPNGEEEISPYGADLEQECKKNKLHYEIIHLNEVLEKAGIGSDWIRAYEKRMQRK